MNLWQEKVVQRLFQEEPEHEENEQMEDGGDEVTLGQSLQHHHSVRHQTFWFLLCCHEMIVNSDLPALLVPPIDVCFVSHRLNRNWSMKVRRVQKQIAAIQEKRRSP